MMLHVAELLLLLTIGDLCAGAGSRVGRDDLLVCHALCNGP